MPDEFQEASIMKIILTERLVYKRPLILPCTDKWARRDSDPRPSGYQPNALTKLRHGPMEKDINVFVPTIIKVFSGHNVEIFAMRKYFRRFKRFKRRARRSVGRSLPSQGRGPGFESRRVHSFHPTLLERPGLSDVNGILSKSRNPPGIEVESR